MKVKDFMTTNIVKTSTDASIYEIAKVMKDNDIGSVPICEGDKVVGIVTDRDIVIRCLANGKQNQNVVARDVLTPSLATIDSNSDIHLATKVMADNQVRRLPVVDNGKLVGMLAIGDISVNDKLGDDAGEALSDISEKSDRLF